MLSELCSLSGTSFESVLRKLSHLWVRHFFLHHVFSESHRGHPKGLLVPRLFDALDQAIKLAPDFKESFQAEMLSCKRLENSWPVVSKALDHAFDLLLPISVDLSELIKAEVPKTVSSSIWPLVTYYGLECMLFLLMEGISEREESGSWFEDVLPRSDFIRQRKLYHKIRELIAISSLDWSGEELSKEELVRIDLMAEEQCDWVVTSPAAMRIRYERRLLNALAALPAVRRARLVAMVEKYSVSDGPVESKQIAIGLDAEHAKLVCFWENSSGTDFFHPKNRNSPLWSAKQILFELHSDAILAAIKEPVTLEDFSRLIEGDITRLNDAMIDLLGKGMIDKPSDIMDPKFNS